MEMDMELEAVPGEKTSAILTTSKKGSQRVVLLCHGFMSSKESQTNRELTRHFLPRDIATLRYDLFGHGESGGPFEALTLTRCLLQMKGVLHWLKEAGFTRIGLVGSSFGGLIAIHAAAEHPGFLGLALKCPVSNYPAIWRDRLGEGGMKNWQESGTLSLATPEGRGRLEFAFYEDLLRYDSYKKASSLQIPTCIVHGDADEYVPITQSRKLLENLSSKKKMVVIPGANHDFSRPDDFEKMIAQISGWMIQRLS